MPDEGRAPRSPRSSHFFRAAALDFDGTLTEAERPAPAVLEALAETRGAGWRVILVTGRILSELRAVFPDVEQWFDAIVAENGAVIWSPGRGTRTVAPPVSSKLEEVLLSLEVPVRRGQALLASTARFDEIILRESGRLGLECQLIHNRAELMVLPPGITKGTGALEALADLGVSPRSTIALGDAENDHSLFDVCELGVAVANAVEGLKSRADVVLAAADGTGVVNCLHGAIFHEQFRIASPRRQVRVGSYPDGRAAAVPSAQVNVLVTGGSQTGKSCLASLLAERLLARGYSLTVLDPEGDHLGLNRFPGVITMGGCDSVPNETLLRRLLQRGRDSAVIDLCLRPPEEKRQALKQIWAALTSIRADSGLPHWIFVDEAHLLPSSLAQLSAPDETLRGLCAITWRPGDLDPALLGTLDLILARPGPDLEGLAALPLHPALRQHLTREALAAFAIPAPEQALLIDSEGIRSFTADRLTRAQVRHWHKYLHATLPPHQRFYFRTPSGSTGAVAANIAEFHDAMLRLEDEVLGHHAGHNDFSRWIAGVIRDSELAREVRTLERALQKGGDLPPFRQAMVALIEEWFPEEAEVESGRPVSRARS